MPFQKSGNSRLVDVTVKLSNWSIKATEPSVGSLPVAASSEARLSTAIGAKATNVHPRVLAYIAFTAAVASSCVFQNCSTGFCAWGGTSRKLFVQPKRKIPDNKPSVAEVFLIFILIVFI